MSAFVVSHAHINALVSWANHFKRKTRLSSSTLADHPEMLGQLLLDANIDSVNYRYAHNKDAQCEPETFTWQPSKARELSAVEALKALVCLDYQSCERPDWEEKQAAKIIAQLKSAAISELEGYEAATWCIEEEETETA